MKNPYDAHFHLASTTSAQPKPKDLTTEQANTTGKEEPRKAFNTTDISATLTPSNLKAIIGNVYGGDMQKFLTLAEQMEERYTIYRTAISTRKMAVSNLPIVVTPASGDAKDGEIATAVKNMLDSQVVRSQVINMLDAIAKGYSVCELTWDTTKTPWQPKTIVWKDPRWFVFSPEDNETLFLKGENDIKTPLQPYKFIIHKPTLKSGIPARGGIAFALMTLYLFQAERVNDWMAYIDKFGYPMLIGKYADNATKDDIDTLKRGVAQFGTDAAMVTSLQTMIEVIESKSSTGTGKIAFESFVDFINTCATTLVLGQNLTTQDGVSLSQSQVHNEVRKVLVQSDAAGLAETLNNTLVRWFVELNYGQNVAIPRIDFFMEDKIELGTWVSSVEKMAKLRLPVPMKDVYERLGMTPPSKDEQVLMVGGQQKSAKPHKLATTLTTSLTAHTASQQDVMGENNIWADFSTAVAEVLDAKMASMESYDDLIVYLNSGALLEDVDFATTLGDDLTMEQFKAYVDGWADFGQVSR